MRRVVLTCFFLSGAAALIYEVVWTRQIVHVVGASSTAVSTVLAVYMTGLALGAWALGRLADRSARPLRLYAYIELALAAYALALPKLVAASQPLYVATVRAVGTGSASLTALRVALGVALLLVPTALLGGTLPVLVRAVDRSPDRFGREFGALYGANVAGAVAGTVLAGFVLIRSLGVQGAAGVAVVLDLAVAAAAYVAGGRAPEATSSKPPDATDATDAAPAADPPLAASRTRWWVAAFASGFLSLASEVLWTRALVFSFQSTVYAFSVILATFLTGLAVGSALFAKYLNRARDPSRVLGLASVGAGVTALLALPLATRGARVLDLLSERIGFTGGAYLAGMVVIAAVALLAPSTLMGTMFPLAARLLATDARRASRQVGAAYLVNTVGAVLGSLLTGFLFVPTLSLAGSLLACAAAQLALGAWWLAGRARPAHFAGLAAVTAAAFAVALPVLGRPAPFDQFELAEGNERPAVLASRDDSTASVAVVRYADGRRSVRIDGFEAAATLGGYGYMPLMSLLPVALHPNPRRVLVISFGTGTTAGSSLAHPDVRLDAVDINATVLAFADWFRADNRGVAHDPRARLIHDDGRNHLLVTRERYDVITSEPMPPTYAGVVNLYSREYYELARARLNPGGFLVQWLPFHLLLAKESWAILRTVQAVFPETALFYRDGTGIIVARHGGPVALDLAVLRRHLAIPSMRAALERVGIRGLTSLADTWHVGPAAVRALTRDAAVITDDDPSLEYHPLRHAATRGTGPYLPEAARVHDALWRARLHESLPLRNATESERAVLDETIRATSRLSLARLLRDLRRVREARAVLEEALVAVPDPGWQARFRAALDALPR